MQKNNRLGHIFFKSALVSLGKTDEGGREGEEREREVEQQHKNETGNGNEWD